MTETLLINFLFLLFPLLILLVFFENKLNLHNTNKNALLILFLSSLSMILCMTYPIHLELGFIFDLRYIPFILAALYGGYKVAFPLYIVLNTYRFFIGGEGVYMSLLFATIVFILVPIWSKKFKQLDSRNRVVMAGVASLFTMTLYLLSLTRFFQTLDNEFWQITVNVITIHVGGTIVIMTLIEKMILNIKAREKYLNSDRLNVISELSASISHEIRNPLTVTSGFLQLLDKSKNTSQEEKRYISFSLQELKRAEKIISDFLSLAKPQAENMVTSNLKEEVEYVHNIMIPYANIHQVALQLRFTNTLTKRYDKNQIRQCLINLYKNGIESMKEKGGTLSVEVSGDKGKIKIEIKDTGIGMTEEELLRMGKPYYSTKEEGTGLGMMIVFSIMNKMGGRIKVNSEKEKGTTFLISIPV